MGFRSLIYRLYARRLEASLLPEAIPRHVGVMCDGNRRWARSAGLLDVSSGHQEGADKIFELLDWCREAGVEVVTLWLLSTDNLTRPQAELEPLLKIIEDTVRPAGRRHWHLNPMGALDLLPDETATVLKDTAAATAHIPGCWSTWPSVMAAAARSPMRSGPAAGTRRPGHPHRGTGRDPRRRAHRRPPLHRGPARPRPGHPHLGRAALGGFLLWQTPTPSSTSATPTGPPSARSTSSAPSAPTPTATAASAVHPGFTLSLCGTGCAPPRKSHPPHGTPHAAQEPRPWARWSGISR